MSNRWLIYPVPHPLPWVVSLARYHKEPFPPTKYLSVLTATQWLNKFRGGISRVWTQGIIFCHWVTSPAPRIIFNYVLLPLVHIVHICRVQCNLFEHGSRVWRLDGDNCHLHYFGHLPFFLFVKNKNVFYQLFLLWNIRLVVVNLSDLIVLKNIRSYFFYATSFINRALNIPPRLWQPLFYSLFL